MQKFGNHFIFAHAADLTQMRRHILRYKKIVRRARPDKGNGNHQNQHQHQNQLHGDHLVQRGVKQIDSCDNGAAEAELYPANISNLLRDLVGHQDHRDRIDCGSQDIQKQ